jgi:hypothetical protein
LTVFQRQLEAQFDVIRNSGIEIPLDVSKTLIKLFNEINRGFPELDLPAFAFHSRREVLLSQLSFGIQKIAGHLSSGSVYRICFPIESGSFSPRSTADNSWANFTVFYAIGLKPLEWSDARRRTGEPNPYTWEIVDLALNQAGAILALFTPRR